MHPVTVIFIGPQGSGKGTQVKLLKAYLETHDPEHNIVEVQTGAGFRALSAVESYTADRVRSILAQGALAPNFITEAMVVNQMMQDLTSHSHLIMDGFPRTLTQAAFIDELLAFYLRERVIIIHLKTPDEVVMNRLHTRGREDDTEEVIHERLRHYHEMTEPLIEFYTARPNTDFIVVDGSLSIEEVHAEILKQLEDINA